MLSESQTASSSGTPSLNNSERLPAEAMLEKKSRRVSSLKRVLLTFWLYALAITLVIPAFPSLLLEVTHGSSEKASRYYGAASSLRYFLEFFSSPYLGNLSDSYGRKNILLMSLCIMALELFILGAFPSVFAIFAMSVLSGLGNAAMTMGYAIVTDIAHIKNEPVTNNFAYFNAGLSNARRSWRCR